mgnify:CR=1 FL=1
MVVRLSSVKTARLALENTGMLYWALSVDYRRQYGGILDDRHVAGFGCSILNGWLDWRFCGLGG